MLIAGFTTREIAARIGRSPHFVRKLLNHDLFLTTAQEVEQELSSCLDLRISGLYDVALKRLREMLNDEDVEVRLKAIDRVLRVEETRFKRVSDEEMRRLAFEDSDSHEQENALPSPQSLGGGESSGLPHQRYERFRLPAAPLDAEQLQRQLQAITQIKASLESARTVLDVTPKQETPPPEDSSNGKHDLDDQLLDEVD